MRAHYKEIQLLELNTKTDKDAQFVADLVRKHYPNTAYSVSLEIIKGQKEHIYFKALWNGELIGMSGMHKKTPTLAETVKTIIFHEYRGRGLGSAVSMAIELECKRRGIKKVMTTIYAQNVPMITIKLKQGYQIEGYHPDHEAPGFHEYSLGKVLQA